MHLDLLDRVQSFAGEVRGVATQASTIIPLRPAEPHFLPAVRVLDKPDWPAAPVALPAHEVARLENVIAIGGARLVITASGGLLHEEMSAPESEHYGAKLPFIRAHVANRALVHIEMDDASQSRKALCWPVTRLQLLSLDVRVAAQS